MNIETGAKLSETIGTVGELSTSHDEWRELNNCATSNRVDTD